MSAYRHLVTAAAFLLVAPGFSTPALSAPITFVFEGIVSSITNDTRVLSFLGSSFTGQYRFESTQPGSVLSEGHYGGYVGTSQIEFSNGFAWSDGNTHIRVYNDFAQNYPCSACVDGYDIVLSSGPAIPSGLPGLRFNGGYLVGLRDMSAAALQSIALPLAPPDVNRFDLEFSHINFVDDLLHLNVFVNLHVTSIRVPESGTLALLSLGLGALAFARRPRIASVRRAVR